MNGKLWIVIGIALIAFIAWIVLPILDKEMMKVPFTDGAGAAARGDVEGMRASFTPTARLIAAGKTVPMKDLLSALSEDIKSGYFRSSLRVSELVKTGSLPGGKVQADVQLWIYLDTEDDRTLPVPLRASVTLQRTGWFRYKIDEMKTDEELIAQLAARANKSLKKGE